MPCTGDKWETSRVKSSPHLRQNKLKSKIHANAQLHTGINQTVQPICEKKIGRLTKSTTGSFSALENDLDNLLQTVSFFNASTASRAHTFKTHCTQGDVPVPHYDINSCTLPWNFIVIRDQEAWTLSTPTAAPTYLEWILRSNSGTGPVQYVLCEPTWPIKGSVRDHERVIGFEVSEE